jgi:hypothetical protein
MATTQARSWERLAPLTGVLAVVLWIVGTFLLENTDRPDEDEGANFRTWVQENETELSVGVIVFGFGTLFFLWFLGSLRAKLLAAEGGPGRVTTIGFASGVATAISMLFAVLPHAQAAIDIDSVSNSSAAALVHMGDVFYGGIQLFAIPLVFATGLVIARYGALPRWLAWFSFVLALILVIIPIGWLGVFIGLPVWVLVTAVLLWKHPAAEAPASASPPTAPAA